VTALERQLAALSASYKAAQPDIEAETAQGVFDRYLEAVETPHRRGCRALRYGEASACNCGRAEVVAKATAEYSASIARVKASGVQLFTRARLEAEFDRLQGVRS